jgi:hypothetical protein
MPDLFISHAHQDAAVAAAICEARNFPCWVAPRDIPHGSEWVDAIEDGLASCRVMVLVSSTHLNLSKHVKRELQLATTTASSARRP